MSAKSLPSPVEHLQEWKEFDHDMCETLNSQPCLVLVGDIVTVKLLLPIVDAACERADVLKAFAEEHVDRANSTPLCRMPCMPRVLFTTQRNQSTVQDCIAVHGRIPFLAIVVMCDGNDERSYVLDLKGGGTTGAASSLAVDTMAEFLTRVGHGMEPRSLQGVAAPPADVFVPKQGAVLCEARAAVTHSFDRLIAKAETPASTVSLWTNNSTASTSSPSSPQEPVGADGEVAQRFAFGAVGVFWSDRCPCCPSALMMMEAIVRLIRCVAARHLGHAASAGVDYAFPFVVANIDDNEFSTEAWPVGRRVQVVPSIVAYTGPSRTPILYTGERCPVRLVRFLCTHCLPPREMVSCTSKIKEEAEKVVVQLSVEELSATIPEGSESYHDALLAWKAVEEAAAADPETPVSDRVLASMYAAFNEAREKSLSFSIEAITRRVLNNDGVTAEECCSGSQFDVMCDRDDCDAVLTRSLEDKNFSVPRAGKRPRE